MIRTVPDVNVKKEEKPLSEKLELLKETLSPIKFNDKVSIKIETLKSIIDYCFGNEEVHFAHCEPCHLEDDCIVGDKELVFVLYLPDNKYKVTVSSEKNDVKIEII